MKNLKTVAQVYETTDYNGLTTTRGNRAINKLHVHRLKESFRRKYLFAPILINEKDEIIDGQHRYQAAKELGLPIRFSYVNGYGLEEVQMLNTNMKNWTKYDYLNAFCDLGYSEYLKFRNFMRRFPDFDIKACEAILTGQTGNPNTSTKSVLAGRKYKTRYFEEGDLKIPDYEKSVEQAEKIMMIKPYYDGYTRSTFVRSMVGLFKHENYSHSQFLQKLKNQPTALQHCTNITQYKLLIEEIYNYRSREKVSLKY